MSANSARRIRETVNRRDKGKGKGRDTICPGYAREINSFSAVHMPAGIYPLPFAEHKDFSDAAGLVDALAAGFQFVRIVGVYDCGEAVDLDFGFGKFELEELAAALCKVSRAVENRLAL